MLIGIKITKGGKKPPILNFLWKWKKMREQTEKLLKNIKAVETFPLYKNKNLTLKQGLKLKKKFNETGIINVELRRKDIITETNRLIQPTVYYLIRSD